MKTRKNYGAKIMSFLALFAIITGIVGAAFSFIFSSLTTQNPPELTPTELEKIISTFSGANFSTGGQDTFTEILSGSLDTNK